MKGMPNGLRVRWAKLLDEADPEPAPCIIAEDHFLKELPHQDGTGYVKVWIRYDATSTS
jgi:hypothetical protein